MSTQVRCKCQSCTTRSLTGPAVVITVGVLFLLSEVHGGRLHFGNTWPVILLVIGAVMLASSFASREGHIESQAPAIPPAVPPPAVPPPPPPTPPYSSQVQ
jgi:Domain of unknown function (DUF5668)